MSYQNFGCRPYVLAMPKEVRDWLISQGNDVVREKIISWYNEANKDVKSEESEESKAS
jgi:hypothetical protein